MKYKIKTNDNLTNIAKKYNVTLKELLAINPAIINPNSIRVGQVINVPEPASTPAPEVQAEVAPLTASMLLGIVQHGLTLERAEKLVSALNPAMLRGDITTKFRVAMFTAQLAHETGGFKWVKELGKDAYFAKYDGRVDLGNTVPGDGLRYKGRGFIQVTGRNNYAAASEAIGVDILKHPELAETYEVAAKVAVWYWNSRKLSAIADLGTDAAFKLVTKRINGGYNGLADRQAYYNKALKAIA